MSYKTVIFKVSVPPVTILDAMYLRMCIKACVTDAVLRACDDMGVNPTQFYHNAEPIRQSELIDVGTPVPEVILNEINLTVQDNIYRYIAGAVAQLHQSDCLNISTAVYDTNHILLGYEVYHQ